MSIIFTSQKFIEQLNKALNTTTVYGSGGFGASIGNFPSQAQRYYKNNLERLGQAEANRVLETAKIKPSYAFDCVCLVKGILWGWNEIATDVYGGAKPCSNGVPDVGAGKDGLIKYCKDVTTDFSNVLAGELLWLDGHVGVYIGNGEAIECTTAWTNNVQKTVVKNIRTVKNGEHGRSWTSHGKLPWVDYSTAQMYSVVIAGFTSKSDAEKVQAALKVLGTNSIIK